MIHTNEVDFYKVRIKNMFEITFVFTDLSLLDKQMKMEVRLRSMTNVVLTFSTLDGSITTSLVGGNVEVRLYKPANEMDIPLRQYQYDLLVWDVDTEHVETLMQGGFEIITNITNR